MVWRIEVTSCHNAAGGRLISWGWNAAVRTFRVVSEGLAISSTTSAAVPRRAEPEKRSSAAVTIALTATTPTTAMTNAGHCPAIVFRLSPMPTLIRNRSEEHTSELQSLMRISYAVFCLKKKKQYEIEQHNTITTK